MTAINALAIADAIVETINDAELSVPVTANRLYVPAFDLRDMQTLHVSVVPRSSHEAHETRADILETIEIDLAVQQHIGKIEPDALMGLTDEIVDLFRFGSLDDPAARNTEIVRVLFDAESIEKRKLFQSVVTLRFELIE